MYVCVATATFSCELWIDNWIVITWPATWSSLLPTPFSSLPSLSLSRSSSLLLYVLNSSVKWSTYANNTFLHATHSTVSKIQFKFSSSFNFKKEKHWLKFCIRPVRNCISFGRSAHARTHTYTPIKVAKRSENNNKVKKRNILQLGSCNGQQSTCVKWSKTGLKFTQCDKPSFSYCLGMFFHASMRPRVIWLM